MDANLRRHDDKGIAGELEFIASAISVRLPGHSFVYVSKTAQQSDIVTDIVTTLNVASAVSESSMWPDILAIVGLIAIMTRQRHAHS